jgi:hypothetical protein
MGVEGPANNKGDDSHDALQAGGEPVKNRNPPHRDAGNQKELK